MLKELISEMFYKIDKYYVTTKKVRVPTKGDTSLYSNGGLNVFNSGEIELPKGTKIWFDESQDGSLGTIYYYYFIVDGQKAQKASSWSSWSKSNMKEISRAEYRKGLK